MEEHDPNTHLERDVVQQQGSVGQQRVLGVKLRVELGRVLQPDKLGLALYPLVHLGSGHGDHDVDD